MTQVWKIAPGENASHWENCRKLGCILLGWRSLKNYRKYTSEKAVLSALGGGPGAGAGAAKSVWRFTHEVKPTDIVVANMGRSSVVGIGIIDSEYLPPSSPLNPSDSELLPHARLVKWFITQPIDLGPFFFGMSTVHSLTAGKINRIKLAYLKKYPKLNGTLEKLLDGALIDDSNDSKTKKSLTSAEQQLVDADAFNPVGIKDARERTLLSIVRRRGQPAFRKQLLAIYNGRCVITGCKVDAVLEAAHIIPFKGPNANHPGNGLLLRADIHTLFDLRLLAVDVTTMSVLVSPKLNGTGYEKYHGKRIRLPNEISSQPSQEALQQHWLQCRFSC